MKKSKEYNRVIYIVSIIIAYYLAVLLHEYGHGTLAWLFDLKKTPFDIQYSDFFLSHVDEGVDYTNLLATGRGKIAAMIAIAGITMSSLLFIISLVILRTRKIKKHPSLFYFFYWFALINMIPIFNYIPIRTFSKYGDIGRFVHGLDISAWWVICIGIPLVFLGIFYFFYSITPRAYKILKFKEHRKRFLFMSLAVVFWGIFSHGFGSLSDSTVPVFATIVAWASLALPFVGFFIFNPSNDWMKKRIKKLSSN